MKFEDAARLEDAGGFAEIAHDGLLRRDVLKNDKGENQIERFVGEHRECSVGRVQGDVGQIGEEGPPAVHHARSDVDSGDLCGAGG